MLPLWQPSGTRRDYKSRALLRPVSARKESGHLTKKPALPKPRSGPKRRTKAVAKGKPRWTPKQRLFVKEYMVDLNATQAAIRSGYSVKTAKEIGHENLTKLHIAHAIEIERAKRIERTEVNADWVVQKLKLIADSQVTNVAKWGTDRLAFTDSDKLEPAEAAAIRGVKMGKFGLELQMIDPTPAIRMLGEHTRAFQPEQHNQLVQVNIVVDDKREVKEEIVMPPGGNGSHG